MSNKDIFQNEDDIFVIPSNKKFNKVELDVKEGPICYASCKGEFSNKFRYKIINIGDFEEMKKRNIPITGDIVGYDEKDNSFEVKVRKE